MRYAILGTGDGSLYFRQEFLPIEVGQHWHDQVRGSSYWKVEAIRIAICARITLRCLANGAVRETTELGLKRDYRFLP